MDNLRIAQLLVGEPFGGAENFFVKLALAFQRRGIPQRLYILKDKARATELRDGGCDVMELEFGKGWADLMARRKMQKDVNAFGPDVMMAWMSRAARRMPRGNFVKVARLGGYYPPRSYKRCDWLVTATPGIRDFLIDEGWPESRVRQLNNFGELKSCDPASRAELDTPDDAFVFLCLGRLHPSKGFDLAIEAVKQTPGAYLWIAGTGEEESKLRQLADSTGTSDRVRFLGWRDDQAALLKAADVCLVPSRHEPLSNVVLEAWSLGAPVLATASEGPSWLIEDGTNGLVTPLDEVEGLAEGMGRLMQDRQLLEKVASAGKAEQQSKFSEEAVCNRYFEFFQEILQR